MKTLNDIEEVYWDEQRDFRGNKRKIHGGVQLQGLASDVKGRI